MITNEIDSEVQSKLDRKKKVKSELNEHLNNLKPVRTFHMHSTKPLQIVVTRTFLSMLDTISKTLQVNSDSSNEIQAKSSGGEYEIYELEEEMLLEKFKNRRMQESIQPEEHQDDNRSLPVEDFSDEKNEEHEENPSFNFLIKNELGVEVLLEAVNGFQV
jgi:hypothetical protein